MELSHTCRRLCLENLLLFSSTVTLQVVSQIHDSVRAHAIQAACRAPNATYNNGPGAQEGGLDGHAQTAGAGAHDQHARLVGRLDRILFLVHG